MAIQLVIERAEVKIDPIAQPHTGARQWWVSCNGMILAYCDTEDEANAVLREIRSIRGRLSMATVLAPLDETDILVGDELIAWFIDGADTTWSPIGMRGDKRVKEIHTRGDKRVAHVVDGDTITLTGYKWQVRRAS